MYLLRELRKKHSFLYNKGASHKILCIGACKRHYTFKKKKMATWPRRKENNDRIFNNGVSIIFIPFSQLMNAWVELKLPDATGLQRLNNQSVVSVGREWGRRQRNGNFHQLPTIKSAPLEGLCKLSHRRNERAGSDQQDTPTYLSGYEAVSLGVRLRKIREITGLDITEKPMDSCMVFV